MSIWFDQFVCIKVYGGGDVFYGLLGFVCCWIQYLVNQVVDFWFD